MTPVEVPLAQIDPHPGNYNQHPPGQVAVLAESLRVFGQVRTVALQRQPTGRYTAVAGHGVIEGARAAGLPAVAATLIPEDWPPAKVLAYLAADNETGRQAEPDTVALAALVRQVQDSDAALAALAAGGAERLAELREGETDAGATQPFVQRLPATAWALVGVPLEKWPDLQAAIKAFDGAAGCIVETVTK